MNTANHHLGRLLCLFLVAGAGSGLAFAVLLGLLVLLLQPAAARADELAGPPPPAELTLADVGRGSLLWPGEQAGRYRPAPLLSTDVRMQISGMTARVQVTQRFRNPSDRWQEGVYVFPLPDNAAVDRLKLQIGERVIEGVIKERAAARKIYQQAKQSGRKAALVEQQRPNVFTNAVANVGPGEEVVVRIGYLQTLNYDHGEFRLRFPMVVAPRYVPGRPIDMRLPTLDGGGWAPDTDQVPDASRITPPVVPPGQGPVNPVNLTATLAAGLPLAELRSASHAVQIEHGADGSEHVSLSGGQYADRDFELVWRPETDKAPRAALFAERRDDADYGLLMLMPPAAEQAAVQRAARQSVFVIDTSGSMAGTSLPQAKAALLLALRRLRDNDSFNIIQFNSNTSSLFPRPMPANRGTIAQAVRYVNGLQAGGGTEMAPALYAALATQDEGPAVRQVVFLTDGSVANEQALFRIIHQHLGNSRLFTVGIGSAPNGHFMTRAARFGRGTFTYIGQLDQVQERMQALFAKLENPVLTDIRVRWPDGQQAEAWPARIPDLYAGEPLVLHVRLARLDGQVTVTGQLGGQPWRAVVPVHADPASADSGIAALWARSKITDLMEGLARGEDPQAVRRSVLEVALAHRLVSKYTSLVAVDVTPSRPAGEPSDTTAVPTNLPAGWQHDKVFGVPQTATAAPLHLALGLLAVLILLLVGAAWRPRHPSEAA